MDRPALQYFKSNNVCGGSVALPPPLVTEHPEDLTRYNFSDQMSESSDHDVVFVTRDWNNDEEIGFDMIVFKLISHRYHSADTIRRLPPFAVSGTY
jgi:hypothetical protein